MFLFVYLFIYLFIYLLIHSFVYLFIYLFVYLFIYLFFACINISENIDNQEGLNILYSSPQAPPSLKQCVVPCMSIGKLSVRLLRRSYAQ